MRRVLICGARDWNNYQRILACVMKAHKTQPIDVIIEGECRGGDKLGRKAGEAIGLSVEAGSILPFPALWDKLGKAAGPVRNQQMLDEGLPTEVWAFHNDLDHSSGTKDMVLRSLGAGLTVYVITETGWTLRAVNIQPALFSKAWRVVNTDNFGGDYPNEQFVGPVCSTKAEAEALQKKANKGHSDYSMRWHKIVELPYTLQPGFEP